MSQYSYQMKLNPPFVPRLFTGSCCTQFPSASWMASFPPVNALHLHPVSPHFVASGHDCGQILPIEDWKHPGSCTCVLSSLPPTASLP